MKLYTKQSLSQNDTVTQLWSKVVGSVVNQLRTDATKKSTVIYGPQGVGKEDAAKAIFKSLATGTSVLVTTNGSFFTIETMMSQIGYEYIFVDGIDTIDSGTQEKMIQYMHKHPNVKFIVGATKKLEVLVQGGSMRRDLFDAISHTSVNVQPISNREEGVNTWAKATATTAFKEAGKTFAGFSPEAEKAVTGYNWPGNDEELRSTLTKAAWTTTAGEMVTSRDLGIIVSTGSNVVSINRPKFEVVTGGVTMSAAGETVVETYTTQKKRWVEAFEREYLESTLRRHHGNVTSAAKEACIDRSNFLRLLRRYQIKSKVYREAA